MIDLSSKTAVVTGAGQGVGLGIATAMAKKGAKVAMLGASNERCLKQKQSADNTQRSSGLTDDDRLYQSKHLNDAMTMPSGVATVDYQ